MKRLGMLFLLSAISVVWFSGKLTQSQVPEERKYVVGILIDCDDESLKNYVESHLKRELRSLKDVQIAANLAETYYAEYLIIINLLEIKFQSGKKSGFVAVAASYMQCWQGEKLMATINKDFIKEESKEFAFVYFSRMGLVYMPSEMLVAHLRRDNMDKYCKDFIADFDIKMLDKARQNR